MTHWHVVRHSEDDDPFITDDVYAAADYAATELDRLADFEHDGIRVSGDAGDHEEAYKSFQKWETLRNLHDNAANIAKQARSKPADRAPAYRDEIVYDPDSGEVNTASRLYVAAVHVVEEINAESGFGIWQCQAETGVYPESDRDNAGNLYCKEYE